MTDVPPLLRRLLAEAFPNSPRLVAIFEDLALALIETKETAEAAASGDVQSAHVVMALASDAFPSGRVLTEGTGIDIEETPGLVTLSVSDEVPLIEGGYSVRFVVTGDTDLLLPTVGQVATLADIGTVVGAYQPLDATLTALAGLNATAGLVEQTGVDAFTKRAIGTGAATSILSRGDGDGRYVLQTTYTAADVLAKLLTVDGSGSGLDADLLDAQSGAFYLSRANHTGLQLSTTISDFTEAAQDAVGAMVDASLVYVDGTPLLTRAALTGDAAAPQGSNTLTLATVNANVGSFGSATQVATFTVNAKGLTTAAANVAIAIPASQVTDFSEAVDDRVAVLIQNGTGITWSYNDATGTLTPTVTITQYTDEMARDALGTALTGGTGISITPNDGADTISVAISDPELLSIAGLVSAADRFPYFTGSGTASLAALSAVARTLLGQTTVADMRSTGLLLGTMATQDAVSVTITGGSITGLSVLRATGVQATGDLPAGSGPTSFQDYNTASSAGRVGNLNLTTFAWGLFHVMGNPTVLFNNGTAIAQTSSTGWEPSTDNTYYLGRNDDDSPKAWKGIILKDQAGTGKYYRLEVNANALLLVDLTD